jgi:hypothetical protein
VAIKCCFKASKTAEEVHTAYDMEEYRDPTFFTGMDDFVKGRKMFQPTPGVVATQMAKSKNVQQLLLKL